jgi:Met-zincin/Domain of unknown function (DUF5117)/Domain of unknown function (DUF5118)
MSRSFTILLAFLAPTYAVALQDPAPPEAGAADAGKDDKASAAEKKDKKSGIKPYDTVITAEATTKKGVFDVHRLDDKLYFEIPRAQLDKDFLWVTQLAQTLAGYGLGGTGVLDRVIRFELRDEKILLRDVKYGIRADVDDPVKEAVANTSVLPILRSFPVKAWGKDQAPVIEVTDLFMSDSSEFGVGKQINASGMDKERSFLEDVKAFPRNIETKVLATFRVGGGAPRAFPLPSMGGGTDPSLSALTVLVHYSMIALPDTKMRPRISDTRVGYFGVSFQDFGTSEHRVKRVEYVSRWRLEKKDPAAAISDPVTPITFYIARETPTKWRPYIKQGVEAWNSAFEKAGYSNAIRCIEAPSRREDPDWDAEDARYSTLRWLPSTIENAMGPHVADPRTGEILEADILIFHNLLRLLSSWYFIQCAPLDPRAQKLPLPDDLLGELLAYVVTHEVGHSLGLRHNMKASSAYTVDQLRSKEFTEKYGTESSIMDYGRFNYVAQPGDGARLIPLIGPYDDFSIEWGYREFPGTQSAEDDRVHLAKICERQLTDPMLRFGDPNASEDPSQQTEDLGSDSVVATQLGIANLKRVAELLIPATCKDGEDYEILDAMYDEMMGQLDRELGHVANVVGGLRGRDIRHGQGERIFEPVPADEQRRAVAFLIANVFETPVWTMPPVILDRIQKSGAPSRLLSSQSRLLSTLLSSSRLARMSEHATRATPAYAPADLLLDLRLGIFRELSERPVAPTLHRRNLQRAYLDLLIARSSSEDAGNDDAALARLELIALEELTKTALEATKDDRTVRAHLLDTASDIARALAID